MTAVRDFDWFLDRLEVARWNDEAAGSRDFLGGCPVCGGSDPLHVTEKNGKALLKCFSCDAKYADIIEALEEPAGESVHDEPAGNPAVTVRSAEGQHAVLEPAGESVHDEPAASPLDWAAARCGMTRAELDALDLPISERPGRVVFEFGRPGIAKTRGTIESKRKDITWEGVTPPFWPVPEQPGPEVVVCEGEFDAVVLRRAGYEAYSITGGAGNGPDPAAWRALRELGATLVGFVFDEDAAGRKGLASAVEAAREAGLLTKLMRVVGVEPLLDEKDARDVAVRVGAAAVELEDAVDEEGPQPLSLVPSVTPEPLWLGCIHPTEHTVLYGDGGTGKGVLAAWWVANLVAEGKRVLVVDYEAHAQHEWRPRVENFLRHMPSKPGEPPHVTKMDAVSIIQPTKPIWDIQDWLRDAALSCQADLIVVDSVVYACRGEEAEKSVVAIKYSMAINRLGCPVLSLGHVTKADANPRHPFGSAYWSNGARVTMALSRTRPDVPDAPRLLQNWKSNQAHEFAPVEVDWSWLGAGLPPRLEFSAAKVKAVASMAAWRDQWLLDHDGREPSNEEAYAAFPGMKPLTAKGTLYRLQRGAKVTMKSAVDKRGEP